MTFLNNDQVETATITASSEVANFEGANLADLRLVKTWRSTGDISENVVFDFGSAKAIDAVALVSHNLTNAATITLQANSSDSWGAPPVSEVLTWKDGIIWKTFATQTYQFWRLLIADAANPDTYIEVGRVILDTAYVLDELPNEQFSTEQIDDSVVFFSLTGQIFADVGLLYKRYTQGVGVMANATRQNLQLFLESVGIYTPFVLIPYEADDSKIAPLYCVLDRGFQFNFAGGWAWNDNRLSFREVF